MSRRSRDTPASASMSQQQATNDFELHELLPNRSNISNSDDPERATLSQSSQQQTKPPHQARWLTPEYLFYFAFLTFCYIQGTILVLDRSNSLDTSRYRFLIDGWIFQRKVDVADGQYRSFRSELPTLTAVAVMFLGLSKGVKWMWKNSLTARLIFYSLFSFCFLLYINGSCTFFILFIITINYLLSRLGLFAGGKYATTSIILTWIYNCSILLLNESYHGYSWYNILTSFSESDDILLLSTWLDTHRGLIPWYGLFNLVVLRMISFNYDTIWAGQQRVNYEKDGKTIITFNRHAQKCQDGCRARGKDGACIWWREKEHHAVQEYSFLSYFTYLFYIPLHFAGPTITFNSFLSQLKSPQQSYDTRGLLYYLVMKVGFIFLLLEIWLHYMYIYIMTHDKELFKSLQPYEMCMVSYYTLVGIWLKFTAIWRFFRCWSLYDGIEPPENMLRCVSNNYSIQSFWRAWHRSFNRWLVRYIYVPLGGGSGGGSGGGAENSTQNIISPSAIGLSSVHSPTSTISSTSPTRSSAAPPSKLRLILRQSMNIFLTFSFVAFWHDRTLQLLTWGWLVALLFIPELTANTVFNTKGFKWIQKEWYWRHIKGIGATISIFMMMIANLIGYSVGIDGTSSILDTMSRDGGWTMICVVFTAFFSASMIMFECRETGITVD